MASYSDVGVEVGCRCQRCQRVCGAGRTIYDCLAKSARWKEKHKDFSIDTRLANEYKTRFGIVVLLIGNKVPVLRSYYSCYMKKKKNQAQTPSAPRTNTCGFPFCCPSTSSAALSYPSSSPSRIKGLAASDF